MTLPGIAGLILTIGVAADANIVIFERIKEEVRAGRRCRARRSASATAKGSRRSSTPTCHPADRVHPLRPRDRGRQRLRLHARRRHDRLAVHRRRLHPGLPRGVRSRPAARSPACSAPARAAGEVAPRLHRREPVVLLDLRDDPRRRRPRAGHEPAQPRDRLRIWHEAQLLPAAIGVGRRRRARSARRTQPRRRRGPGNRRRTARQRLPDPGERAGTGRIKAVRRTT